MYDGDTHTPRAYLSSSKNSEDVSVLLFETEAGKDVPFALEFLNGSNSTIYGFDNLPILPGTHFYLLGNIDLAAGQPSGAFPAVFVKGHTTTVQARFSSLKNAHPVLPDLREVQLSVGVDAQMNWNYTPSVSIGISD